REVLWRVGAADRDRRFLLGLELGYGDAALGGALDRVARSELGARHPRADRIDVDVVRAELLRRHPGQRDDRTFARGIGGVRGAGIAAPGDRGDVDDPAA